MLSAPHPQNFLTPPPFSLSRRYGHNNQLFLPCLQLRLRSCTPARCTIGEYPRNRCALLSDRYLSPPHPRHPQLCARCHGRRREHRVEHRRAGKEIPPLL